MNGWRCITILTDRHRSPDQVRKYRPKGAFAMGVSPTRPYRLEGSTPIDRYMLRAYYFVASRVVYFIVACSGAKMRRRSPPGRPTLRETDLQRETRGTDCVSAEQRVSWRVVPAQSAPLATHAGLRTSGGKALASALHTDTEPSDTHATQAHVPVSTQQMRIKQNDTPSGEIQVPSVLQGMRQHAEGGQCDRPTFPRRSAGR